MLKMDNKTTVKGSLVAICILILISFDRVEAQGKDLTVLLEAFGTAVVEATMQQINRLELFNSELLPERMFIRRIAWVETEDGMALFTYSDDQYHGGIWKVDRSAYVITQVMYNNAEYISIFRDIEQCFGITWGQTSWEDCRRPFYSALAARLYYHNLGPDIVPQGLQNQAQLWMDRYHDSPPSQTVDDFIAKVTTLESDGCRVRGVDLVFVLDSSGSVGFDDFEKTKNFVVGVVDSFDIGADRTRVGVIQYSNSVNFEFYLNGYTDKALIKQAIGNIPHLGGGTQTVLALNTMESTGFNVSTGARPANEGLPRVAVVITDGQSQGAAQVAIPSDRARQKGIVIFAIGVTSNVNNDELNAIANKPIESYVFHVSNFDAIGNIGAIIEDSTCNQARQLSTPMINSTLDAGQRQYLQQTVTDEGVTLGIEASSGSVVMYVSTTTPNPNEALYDYRLEAAEGEGTVELFIGPENFNRTGTDGRNGDAEGARRRRQVPSQNDTTTGSPIGTVYMTIEGMQDTNAFVLVVAEGDVTEPTPTPANGCVSQAETLVFITMILLFTARLMAVGLY